MRSGTHRRTHDDARKVLDAIRRIIQVLREFSIGVEREIGLSGAQLFALQTLSRHGSLTVNALAARTLTHQSSVSVVAKKLVERGLVSRRPSDADARCVELAVTAAGRAALARSPAAMQDQLIAAIEALPARDRAALARQLGRVVAGLAPARGSPPMFFEDHASRARGRRQRRD